MGTEFGGIILWNYEILGVDLYHILFWLFLYSFLGWIWESTYVSVKQKRIVNRGFVNGPVCTIYGVGAMSIYLLLHPLREHGLWLFLGGILVATILEYVTAAVMETLFHTSWWDYSSKPFNIKGRICLESSVVWGFFTLLLFEVLHPFAEWVIGLFDVATGHAFVILCSILYAADFTISALAASQLGAKLAKMHAAMEEFGEYLQTTKIYESAEELREVLEPYRKALSLKEMQEKLEELQGKLQKRMEEKDLMDYAENFRMRAKNFREQYQEDFSKITGVNRRFMKAYPNLHKVHKKKIEKHKKEEK